jgi:hypothetical protein
MLLTLHVFFGPCWCSCAMPFNTFASVLHAQAQAEQDGVGEEHQRRRQASTLCKRLFAASHDPQDIKQPNNE